MFRPLATLLLWLLIRPVAAQPITLHASFEGGSLGPVEQVSARHFRCAVQGESDQDQRNRQASWYYFRVDGARGKTLTIDLVALAGEYNYQPNRGAITGATPPWVSEDQRTWKPIATAEYQAAAPLLRLRLTPRTNRFWIAHVPPYTGQDLRRVLRQFKSHPAFAQQSAGRSVQGRDIPLLTITDPRIPEPPKNVIWIMFRQHSWEAGSSWAGEGAIRFLLSEAPMAVIMRQTAIFKILPLCDPDGVARGGVRFNANGYDLNRNWDTVDESRMPEITAQRKAIFEWLDNGHRIDVLLTLHNTETAEYLDGPPDPEGRFRVLQERLFKALSESERFAPTRAPQSLPSSTTVNQPGRMNVVQGLYRDRRVPTFLIEQMITQHPKLGRPPTPDDRRQFGRDLVQALWKAILK